MDKEVGKPEKQAPEEEILYPIFKKREKKGARKLVKEEHKQVVAPSGE
jgi:hypothetical protein